MFKKLDYLPLHAKYSQDHFRAFIFYLFYIFYFFFIFSKNCGRLQTYIIYMSLRKGGKIETLSVNLMFYIEIQYKIPVSKRWCKKSRFKSDRMPE